MIAKEEHCKKILNSSELLAELIKKDGGVTKPDTLIRNLQRASPSIRKSASLIDTLKDAGINEAEIFDSKEV